MPRVYTNNRKWYRWRTLKMALSLDHTQVMRLWCSMNTSLISIMSSHLVYTIPTSLFYSWEFHAHGSGLFGKNTKMRLQDYSVDSHYCQFWSLSMSFLMEIMLENAPGLTSSKHGTWWWWLWQLPQFTKLSWWLLCFSWAKDGKLRDNLSDAMISLTLQY